MSINAIKSMTTIKLQVALESFIKHYKNLIFTNVVYYVYILYY